ncbi:Vacuolar protein sorting-associated protein 62 [Blyttiomyces sp. JEL0837]|nr:Vacuolar protein sorting-associated protein 62 [Blyttiomyces sp. JEL0837]
MLRNLIAPSVMTASLAVAGAIALPANSYLDLAQQLAPQIVFPKEPINGTPLADQPYPLTYSNLDYSARVGADQNKAYLTVAGNVIADDTLPAETHLGKSSPLGRVDDHVGDWERLGIRTVNGQPVSISYYTHGGGGAGTVAWNDSRVKFVPGTQHPVAYSALGSHGMWPTAGANVYHEVLGGLYNLIDDTGDGVQWNTWNNVYPINYQYGGGYTGDLAWLNYGGHYGNPGDYSCWYVKQTKACELADGPPGPNRDLRGPPLSIIGTFNSDPDHSIYNFQIDAGVAAAAASKGYTYAAVHQHCLAASSNDETDNWGFVQFQGGNVVNYSITTDRCQKDRSRHVGSYGIAFCTAADSSKCPSASNMRNVVTYNGNTAANTKGAIVNDIDVWWVNV